MSLEARLPQNLMSDFSAEAASTLAKIEQAQEALRSREDREYLETLFRNVHTYKSLMAFAGMTAQADFAAEMERFLAAIWHGRTPFDCESQELLSQGVSALGAQFRASNNSDTAVDYAPLIQRLQSASMGGRPSNGKICSPEQTQEQESPTPLGAPAFLNESATVNLEELDITLAEISRLSALLHTMSQDGLEEREETLLIAIQRKVKKLQRLVHSARYISLRTSLLPMVTVVRQTAMQDGKIVNVSLQVGREEVERQLLRALHPSLIHILRNAIAHGIEEPRERLALGKRESGEITIKASVANDFLQIAISDDGRGFDVGALREAAIRSGSVNKEAASTTDDKKAISLAFLPGVSTSLAVDDLSGNGMGLAAVAEDVQALDGEVRVDTIPGAGSTITIVVPLHRNQDNASGTLASAPIMAWASA